MTLLGIHLWLVVFAIFPALPSAAQSQSCPVNINYSDGTLTHWKAYTGNNKDGNGPDAIKWQYDGTGESAFPEYNLPGVTGIQVIKYQGADPFGGFPTIPTINGYTYHYSILLGSTSISQRQAMDQSNNGSANNPPAGSGSQGGYVRGVSYLINVPPGPTSLPYTITYAYAMVLENGTHASEFQPMARAIVSTPAGVIDCASPAYYLPTSGGLDSATAEANGFSVSATPTPNESRNPANPGEHLQDVWTKGWTEVNFNLSPYRGQQVTLTFEADNCVPGGHFAYAYFALRDICGGLRMSGDTIACSNSVGNYSIPSLNGASYDWDVPDGWVMQSGSSENSITVTIGAQPGWIVAMEKNSCTSLTDSLFVDLYPGALPKGSTSPHDTTVCYGESAPLRGTVGTGTEFTWSGGGPFTGAATGAITTLPSTTEILAAPKATADYVLNIRNEGCPIIVSDTIVVTVVPPIKVNAGNDTLVVVNQPLHFRATSSDLYRDDYQWSPPLGLSNPTIADPIGQFGPEMNTITYRVTAMDVFGCSGAGSVKVTIAPTLPDIFVPNAFTPGGATNTIFRPVCMGVASLEYFRVYNRWGQLMYSTSQMGQGWDGMVHGKYQDAGAYLWILQGTDYTGKSILKKGTMVLLR
ncbi:MAG TPA: gliding motility-associated C-terminal domain-containing protein [Puia sp.]